VTSKESSRSGEFRVEFGNPSVLPAFTLHIAVWLYELHDVVGAGSTGVSLRSRNSDGRLREPCSNVARTARSPAESRALAHRLEP
jgi:hypothetical protein